MRSEVSVKEPGYSYCPDLQAVAGLHFRSSVEVPALTMNSVVESHTVCAVHDPAFSVVENLPTAQNAQNDSLPLPFMARN